MANKTVATLKSLVRNQLRDPNGTVYDNNSEVTQALEDAQNEIINNFDFRFLLEIEQQDLVASTSTYSLPTDLLHDRVEWVQVKDNGGNTDVRLTPISFDQYKLRTLSSVGETLPTSYTLNEGAQELILYPTPNYNYTSGLTICYYKRPEALTGGDTVTTTLPEEFTRAVVLLACYNILLMAGDDQRALLYKDLANQEMGRLKSQSRQTKSEKMYVRLSNKTNIYTEI